MTSTRVVMWLSLALMLSRCAFDNRAPSNQFPCTDAGLCPGAMTCDPATLLCRDEPYLSKEVTPRVAGLGTTVRVVLELNTAYPQPPSVSASNDRDFTHAFTQTSFDGHRATFEWVVEASAANGTLAITGDFEDAAGRRLSNVLLGSIVVDTVAPTIAPGAAIILTAAPGSLRQDVTALGTLATATLTFALSEAVDTPPVVVCTGGMRSQTVLSFTRVGTSSAPWVYRASPDATPFTGACALAVDAVDAAGNRAVSGQSLVVQVDTEPPSAPDVNGDRLVVFDRAPVTGLAVLGAAAAADPDTEVFAFTDSSGTTASVLGRAHAQPDGRFSLTGLGAVDRPTVWVAAVDSAGNASSLAEVRDVRFHFTIDRRDLTATELNSTQLFTREVESPALVADDTEVGVAQLRQPDGGALSVFGASSWSHRTSDNLATRYGLPCFTATSRATIEGSDYLSNNMVRWADGHWVNSLREDPEGDGVPGNRGYPAGAFDRRRGQFILFGGNTSNGSSIDFSDTWAWSGRSWQLLNPLGPRPPARSRQAMTYDPVHQRVVMLGGETYSDALPDFSDTWVLEEGAWRELPDAGLPTQSAWVAATTEFDGTVVAYTWLNDGGAATLELQNEHWVNETPAPKLFLPLMAHQGRTHETWLAGNAGFTTGVGFDKPRLFARRNGAWLAQPFLQTPLPTVSSFCFEPSNDRLVVVMERQGNPSQTYAETDAGFALLPQPTGVSPPARFGAAATFDPSVSKVLIHGGWQPSGKTLTDSWWWSANGFEPATSGGVSAAEVGAVNLVADPDGGVTLYRCRLDGTGAATTQEVYGRTGASWALRRNADACSASEAVVASPTTGQHVAFGGTRQRFDARPTVSSTTVGVTDPTSGVRTVLAGATWPGRVGLNGFVDPLTSAVSSFGGLLAGEGSTTAQVVQLVGTAWQPAPAGTTVVDSREGAASAVDPYRGVLVVTGGEDANTAASLPWFPFAPVPSAFVYRFGQPEPWQTLRTRDPEGDGAAPWVVDGTLVYDPVRRRLVHFGGTTQLGTSKSQLDLPASNDVYELVTAEHAPSVLVMVKQPDGFASDGGRLRLTVTATAGGLGQTSNGQAQPGASLAVWLDGRWQPFAQNDATELDALTGTVEWAAMPAWRLFQDLNQLGFRVRSRGLNGSTTARVQVTRLDGVLEYRRP